MHSKTSILGVKKILIFIIILVIIAIIDASYLTYHAYILKNTTESIFSIGTSKNIGFACDINTTFSCSSVFKNDFAWIFEIPFSLYALIFYPIIGIIAFLGIKNLISNFFKYIAIIAFGGMLFNGYLISHEYIIGSYCFMCLICTFIITTIFFISMYSMKQKNN